MGAAECRGCITSAPTPDTVKAHPTLLTEETRAGKEKGSLTEEQRLQQEVEEERARGAAAEEERLKRLEKEAAAEKARIFGLAEKTITDVVARFKEEAERKGWWLGLFGKELSELSTNEQTRKEKTAAVEMLHEEIDKLEDQIARVTELGSDIKEAVAHVKAATAEATALSQEAKDGIMQVWSGYHQEVQTAVANGLPILEEKMRRCREEAEEQERLRLKEEAEEQERLRLKEEEQELDAAKEKVAIFLKARGFTKGVAGPKRFCRGCCKTSYPLHVAVEENSAETVAALLRCGADKKAKNSVCLNSVCLNSVGLTPLELAQKLHQKRKSHSAVMAALA